MAMSERERERARVQLLLRWGGLNLLLSVLGVVATLWIRHEERRLSDLARAEEERRAALCDQTVLRAREPPIVDPLGVAPPQDTAKSGYTGPNGVEIRAALRLSLEALRSSTQEHPEMLLLGSQEVLPSQTIHVVNLWATYCEPCRDEMPDFKALLARRTDWGKAVRFVPIELEDDTSPVTAYRDIESLMPSAPVRLADRAYGRPLASALAGTLFHKNLPVTLVLDCNRRVRWARFERLNSVDFTEIEGFIDQFLGELADTSAGSSCTKEWPGNGRCEGNEREPATHVLEDCGPLKRRAEGGAAESPELLPPPPPEPTKPPPVLCGPGEIVSHGVCKKKTKLIGVEPARPRPPATCGDGVCAPGESAKTCCDCIECRPPLVCRLASNGEPACLVKGLK